MTTSTDWDGDSKVRALRSRPSVVQWTIPFNFDLDKYYILQIGDNSLGLQKGDQILKINNVTADLNYAHKNGFYLDLNSLSFNLPSLSMEVLRDGKVLSLYSDQPFEYTLGSPRITLNEDFTAEQQAFRSIFFGRQ